MENLCMNCMETLENGQDICYQCKSNQNMLLSRPFLPTKTLLADRYIVGKGLEINGEGLSYIGYDTFKNSKIYIREFYPPNFCNRNKDEIQVEVSQNYKRVFQNLKTNFLRYFRSIARLRNLPYLVSVYDIFEENNTAYVICEWIDGTRFSKYLSEHGNHLEWKQAQLMFMPLLSSLSNMQASGVKHLGISPDNILVTKEDKLMLSGFATQNLRMNNSILNAQLYDGYSAIEQYIKHHEISENTDIYGFTASLFFALTGSCPPSALQREKNDKLMMSKDILDHLPEHVISALATALRVSPANRTLSFENLRIELSNSPILQIKDIKAKNEDFNYDTNTEIKKRKSHGAVWGILSCFSALTLLLTCLGIYWFWLKDNSAIDKNSNPRQVEESESKDYNTLEQENIHVEEKMPVPSLIGKNFKDLQNEAKDSQKYSLILLSEEFHDSIDEGCIISQTPNAGEEMEPGSTIAVNVSKGSEQKILPDIKGKTLSEVSQLLTNAKFIPTSVFESSEEYHEGEVIGYKEHEAGEILKYGSTVTIIVSKGRN